jgi:hypothetical protein
MGFEGVVRLCQALRRMGLPVRGRRQEGACYVEEFWVERLDELERLDAWVIDEVTLIQVNPSWTGDFFVLAGEHHELYRQRPAMEAYLSLSHPWRVPSAVNLSLHQVEAMFWIGFRNTHGFIRVRVIPGEIITPGETRGDDRRGAWVTERADAFTAALDVLDLPLFVDWSEGTPTVASTEPGCRIAGSWPDAFGPCQFEYVVADRYELLVPAARLIERLGVRPATLRTFLSGWPRSVLAEFHRLQPGSRLLYRGFLQASLDDVPEIVKAIAPHGRVLVTLCEFRTGEVLRTAEESYAVVGVIGSAMGYTIEMRLNRAPLPEHEMEEWLERLIGVPMGYAPLGLY